MFNSEFFVENGDVKLNLEKVMERIRAVDNIHLEERARLLMELGGFGVGGIELGCISEGVRELKTPEEYEKMALEVVIGELWHDSCICYINRRFRACTILLACLVEAVLCMELLKKGKVCKKDWMLGQLKHCKEEGIVPRNVLEAAEAVNKLRIIAVHLKIEREEPRKTFEHSNLDEMVPITNFQRPPVTIHENGSISGDDVMLRVGSEGAFIVYKFKKAAMEAYKNVKVILSSLYGLKFKSSWAF